MHPPLDSIIYQALLADRRPPTGLLHASSHSWLPLRFTQLSQVIPTDESDYGSLMTMKIGTLTHEWLEKYFRTPGVLGSDWALSESECDVTRFLPAGWTGTLDYLLRHKPTSTLAIVDLKTIKPEGVAYLGDSPKPEHTTQVSCYHAAITNAISQGLVTTRSKLQDEIVVVYVPKGKDSKQNTIMPVIKTAPAESSAVANMIGIKRQVDTYLARVHETGEFLNDCLAPMPDMIPKIGWNKSQGVWDVTLREGWETEYIGSQYPEYLVPRRPSCKVGHWTVDNYYVPRKGIVQPDNIPEPNPDEIKRRQS